MCEFGDFFCFFFKDWLLVVEDLFGDIEELKGSFPGE